jgi:hypothetical protein
MRNEACRRCGTEGEVGSAACPNCSALDRTVSQEQEDALLVVLAAAERIIEEHDDDRHSAVVRVTAIPLVNLLIAEMVVGYWGGGARVFLVVAAMGTLLTGVVFLRAVVRSRALSRAAAYQNEVAPLIRRELKRFGLSWAQLSNIAVGVVTKGSDLLELIDQQREAEALFVVEPRSTQVH